MNVGQLKQLLEFVSDDTKIYIEDTILEDFVPVQKAYLDFVIEGDHPEARLLAGEDASIDNEIALVIW